jgi:hypothetical protein
MAMPSPRFTWLPPTHIGARRVRDQTRRTTPNPIIATGDA